MEFFQKGCTISFSKTIRENDLLQFAEISGDFSPNHVDSEFMKNTIYKKCIVHGALLVAYMSRASSQILVDYPSADSDETAVSLGYDRIRFIKPVFIDDTIYVKYTVESCDKLSRRSIAKIEITNQENDLVSIATHILKWVTNTSR